MFTWQTGSAVAVVLLILFVWWLSGRDRKQRAREIDQGLKRAAQTWKERHP